jgi:hypothetical protein
MTLNSCGLLSLSGGVHVPTSGQRRLGVLLAVFAVAVSVALNAAV